jgi:transposase InsO family protein
MMLDRQLTHMMEGLTECHKMATLATGNAMIETFNAKVRAECLDMHWFTCLEEAKNHLEIRQQEYNEERPHSSLNYQTPVSFLAVWQRQQQPKQAAA